MGAVGDARPRGRRDAVRAARRRAGLLAAIVLVIGACGADPAEVRAPAAGASAGSDAVGPLTPEQIARTFGDAVLQVEVDGCGIESGGSSFAIAADLVITNRHVVELDPTPTLISRDGTRVLEARVIGMSDEVDLAVLRVDGVLATVLDWAPTASLSEGQQVIALGYPAPFFTFSVTPGTLNAFDIADGVRVGIVSDESSDYGSSGGPLLTDRGLVAGIVTEFAGDGGRQVLGVSLTHDAVRDEIARILADPQELIEDCDGVAYGGDAVLDLLWDWCEDGAMWACDELYLDALAGSEYEAFGATCGDRIDTDEWCTIEYGAPEAISYGDVDELDGLWDDCASGRGDWAAACDLLFSVAPPGSDYEAFGDSCGERNTPAGWCEELYG